MNKGKWIYIGIAALIVSTALTVQFNHIRQLRSEVAVLKGQAPAVGKDLPVESSSLPAPPRVRGDGTLEQRVADLEKAVAEFARASDYLMERGQLPMAQSKIQEAHDRFMDPNASDRDRLRALDVLRRNRGMTDEVAAQAVAWLQSGTNANTQRALLQQLDGLTNSAFMQPFIAMAASQDSGVREEALENLRHFVGDPQVENLLWNALKSDPDEDVRREAEEALSRGPFSQARLATLQTRALDPQASLDERLVALRALDRAGANAESVTTFLANLAQNTTDTNDKLKLFRAFDDVNDPAVRLPLVTGLQDPNPMIREEAIDALSEHLSDATVRQWLQYVSQNDQDPGVRREAFEVLQED